MVGVDGYERSNSNRMSSLRTGKPYKVPTNFVTISKKEEKKSAKENVIDHIEENREILKQMKAEATK